ncbi:MAG: glutathione S-transferase N-terminal domain-containing protein [Myxococcota bacterium]
MTTEGLQLYHFETCPFCHRVRRAAQRLGVELELLDIFVDNKHLQDLTAATGRRTVPVLRIEDENGVRWMPESADIIAYLESRFGRKQTGT